MIAQREEQFARGHVQPGVVHAREETEESAERVGAAFKHHSAV